MCKRNGQHHHGCTIGQADPTEANDTKDQHHQCGDDQVTDALSRPAAVVTALEVDDTSNDDSAHDDEGQQASERLDATKRLGRVVPPEEGETNDQGQGDDDD